jgi:hypothetical protein
MNRNRSTFATILVALIGAGIIMAGLLTQTPTSTPPDGGIPVEVTTDTIELAGTRTCPDGWCTNIKHYSPDNGFDDPITAHCIKYRSDGSQYVATVHIAEGSGGYGMGCADVTEVYVGAGEEIKCLDPFTLWIDQWQTQWDSTGWHRADSVSFPGVDRSCVNQLD